MKKVEVEMEKKVEMGMVEMEMKKKYLRTKRDKGFDPYYLLTFNFLCGD